MCSLVIISLKVILVFVVGFYLGDREEVHPAFFSLLLTHEHGRTYQQEVCHLVIVHVQRAQNASEIGSNLGEQLATDVKFTLFRLQTPHVHEENVLSLRYLFPSFCVNDGGLLHGIDSVDYDLSGVVRARCASHEILCGPVA